MVVSGHFQAPAALPPEREPPVPTNRKRASYRICRCLCRTSQLLASSGFWLLRVHLLQARDKRVAFRSTPSCQPVPQRMGIVSWELTGAQTDLWAQRLSEFGCEILCCEKLCEDGGLVSVDMYTCTGRYIHLYQ